jgi:multimeric flavodoxin WrbA
VRAVILNGSRHGEQTLAVMHSVIAAELAQRGWSVEPFILRDLDIAYCRGCFGCWDCTPGECLVDDAARDVARSVIQSDLVVFLTPVTFGGYSSQLKKAIDRILCLVHPFFAKRDGETHHVGRYGHYPRLLGVGVATRPDAESERLFTTLVARNAINLLAPASTAGVVWGGEGSTAMRDEVRRLLASIGATA